MRVQFHSVDNFLEELAERPPFPIDPVVRITFLQHLHPASPNIRGLSVVATYLRRDVVVRLDRWCGELWALESETDHAVLNHGKAIRERITRQVKKLGLEAGGGTYEEGEL